ncbi:OmpA family protein [Cyclobacterium jeungdonense]|uniref:OmpA family protein n=1 Tax=Cyclobacterium jeungdonense TaxID=708087 RepID=A0ABT8CFJ8_9BACT|nr:OmpA family protein [Cyclobacterium jeungdonense]MDN3690558.1 OmpA family protein [Cyclobacterium jeungdonense]
MYGLSIIISKAIALSVLAVLITLSVKAQEDSVRYAVSMAYDEQLPLVGVDGNLYFSVAFHPQNNGGSQDPGDIWIAPQEEEGFGVSAPLASLNTPQYDLLVGFLHPDTVLVYHQNLNNRQVMQGYYRSGDRWERGAEHLIPGFRSTGNHFSARLDAEGSLMILSMESFGSYGNEDIYLSFRKDTTWSRPQNLGGTINTYRQELSPYLSPDEKTLYFSTNAYEGEKSIGVYTSRRMGEGWTEWSEPRPLGLPEMEGWDLYFYQDPYRDRYFFTNTRTSDGYGNIIWVGEALVESSEVVAPKESIVPEVAISVPDTSTSSPAEETLPAPSEPELDLTGQLKNLQPGETLVLEKLLFQRASVDLANEESLVELNKLANYLKENPEHVISVEGHTDNYGSSRLNERLSLNRARKVRDILLENGVAFKQVRVNGWGGKKPIATNSTAEGRQKNRRVEIILLN